MNFVRQNPMLIQDADKLEFIVNGAGKIMDETRYQPDPKQPFGLHDCRIDGMRILGNNLELTLKDEFLRFKASDLEAQFVQGNIVIEGIDPEFCSVFIQGKGGKMGSFRGEKLSIEDFTEKYKEFNFEVINEYYGWHRLQFTGWLWMPDTHPKDMTLSLGYFTGDVVYNTEQSKLNNDQNLEIWL